MGSFVLLLLPLSLWFLVSVFATVVNADYKYPPNALPIPFVPELLATALGFILMTWGMVALWWLVVQHERLSIRQIALPLRIGLIGGTSIAVYWLVKFSASNGQNDEFVFIPPLIFVIVLELLLLIRMFFNPSRRSEKSPTTD